VGDVVTAFQPGDKVLVEAELVTAASARAVVRFWVGDASPTRISVPLEIVHPAPKPLYVDPKLVPGMVVAPLDAADDREWWVVPSPYAAVDYWFIERSGSDAGRNALPAEIRVVRPREATS
jgi:hypothetical protein